MKQWQIFVCSTLALLFAAAFWLGTLYYFSRTSRDLTYNAPREATLHVFVHGTFGSSLGLLSFFPVVNDDFKGSRYVKTTRGMRKDDFFYKDQPMLTRGLTRIFPSYDLNVTEGKKYAAYPLIKAYAEMHDLLDSEDEHFFYAFGWSGLLSRQRRRQESLRLYNAISQEVERLKSLGYTTKIKILAHSHGGNVALNLAGINHARHALQQNLPEPTQIEERFLAQQFFRSLKSHDEVKNLPGQKKLDYKPDTPALHIDELYLLGTPIQPETDHYVTDKNSFGIVYNFYSDDDMIQRLDWVSTRRYYSEQRLSFASKNDPNIPHIIQIKIMLDKYHDMNRDADLPWWQRIFSWRTYNTQPTPDPAHRDFWFATWKDDPQDYPSWLAPVPLFILFPAITQLTSQLGEKDVDINLIRVHDRIRIEAYTHGSRTLRATHDLPILFIENVKKNIDPWRPPHKIKQKEFEKISDYVRRASEVTAAP